jgi:protein phosphatase
MQAMGGMGQFGSPFLSTPKTDIATETKSNKLFNVATVDMQGWRKDMEDSHFNELDFSPSEKCGFFGVFDGHSGQKVAMEAKVEMPRLTKKHYDASQLDTANFFHQVYSELDLYLKSRAEGSGATAVVSLISENYITCASVGDSRAVLCRGDKAIDLSEDHKPENDVERARIEAAGGHVANNRVNGELAMSRAIGDFRYKEVEGKPANEQLVIAVPDMVTVERKPEDKFVVVACDGIFDVMSNEEVVAFVLEHRPQCETLAEVAAKMLNHCLAPESEAGSGRPLRGEGTDNMTCTIIELL